MGRLTSLQLQAMAANAPITHTMHLVVPTDAAHTSFATNIFHDPDGAHTISSGRPNTLINAGKRTLEVFAEHLSKTPSGKAARQTIVVDNTGKGFHPGGSYLHGSGSFYADPEECTLQHSIYVWVASTQSWSEITGMRFLADVLKIEYDDDYDTAESSPTGGIASIQVEQIGAWGTLRRPWTKEDGYTVELVGTGWTEP